MSSPLRLPESAQRIARWQWPREFPIAQFPNAPLLAAFAAAGAARLAHGSAHRALRSVFYVALTIWAYEELRSGDNWFRRLVGAGGLLYITAAITGELPS